MVSLENGTKVEKQCGLPWGPDNPPSDVELARKFSQLAGKVLETEQIQSFLKLFQAGIETGETLLELLRLLSRRLSP